MPLNDALSKAFINQYQGGFPISKRPYKEVAEQLGISEEQLILLISRLLDEGWLSRFGPLYDAQKMGGGLTLAAISVPKERFDEVTAIVNSFAEVAHNYRREHRLNMWFVVATEKSEGVERILSAIEGKTGLKVFNCPKQQEFYIGLQLFLDDEGSVDTVALSEDGSKQVSEGSKSIAELDRRIIQATQSGLPLVSKPYQYIADKLSESQGSVIQRMKLMKQAGKLRRIGAVPNHYKLGLCGNGMTVWNIPEKKVAEVGNKIASMDFVSHCYQRPRHLPDWPYNVFAMVHGATKEQAFEKVKLLEAELAPDVFEHETLFSSAILKKTGLRL
ncbi:MAG: Lrp/AsnC family transcriptional regulator [Gammaproteobacteria bacterium]|nr:Lrp/AsnC family transcriptional regulator [Gammaproteobacteria bacterium]